MAGKYRAYSEYKESGLQWLGDIPKHWQVAELKRYSFVKGGCAFSSDSFIDEGEPVIRISDIKQDGSVSLENCKSVSDELAKRYSEFCVMPGELVMAMTGATIGKAGLFSGNKPALINQRVGVFKCDDRCLDYKFLWYLLSSCGYQEHIKLTAFGGAQPNISDTGMVGYMAAIPIIDEQINIANFLDHETAKIDTLIEKQQQLIKLLKEKRQAVISHAVTKGLNPNAPMRDSGVEWLGEVPEHWEVKRIKSLSSLISKGTTPSTIGGEFVNEGIRFLKAENIGKSIVVQPFPEFYITEQVDEKISRSRLRECDVLIIIAGATTGLASIVSSDVLPANTNQAVSFIRPLKSQYSKLIVRWLSTEFAQRIIWMGAVQAAQPNLSMEDLGNIPIVVPPLKELDKIMSSIEDHLAKFDELITKALSAIELMKERRTALISAAVTGKIDVRNWQPPEQSQTNQEVAA